MTDTLEHGIETKVHNKSLIEEMQKAAGNRPERIHLLFINTDVMQIDSDLNVYINDALLNQEIAIDWSNIIIDELAQVQANIDFDKPITQQLHRELNELLDYAWKESITDYFLVVNCESMDEAKRYALMPRDELISNGLTSKFMSLVDYSHYLY